MLASQDVESLFINVPIRDPINIINKKVYKNKKTSPSTIAENHFERFFAVFYNRGSF